MEQFFSDNLTDEMYLQLLEGGINPVLTNFIEHDQQHDEDLLIFQQEGAPPYYGLRLV